MDEPGRGDRDRHVAVGDIAREFAVPMYRVAVAVVRDRALAEDVVQDALLKVWDGLDSFRGDAPLRAWVLRITHNTAVSTLRRVRDQTWDPHRMPDVRRSDAVERVVVARDELRRVEHALRELDELSRTILVLREREGLSYDQIAEALGITIGQVKIRLFRARSKLKDLVAETT